MICKIRFIPSVVVFILALVCLTVAQERFGSIEATVRDQNGAVIPNAAVLVEGNAYSRTVTTNEDGVFRLQQVPPGAYTVTVESGNFQKQTLKNVTVSLGNTSNFEVVLQTAVSGVVEVTSEGVATIDPTSSKIQTDLSAQRLEEIPKGTNFTSALKAAAPVRQEPTAGGFQIDGASGSENSFVIDGQEVTNFRTGTLNNNNNIPFQLIQEIQVKSNGFEAEYGGATGGVINVVTKRGSNDFHGELAMQFEPSKFAAGARRVLTTSTTVSPTASGRYIFPNRDDFLNTFPSIYASGAIIKQRLFYFVSSAPQYLVTNRTWIFPDGGTRTYRSKETRDYNFARLDGQIGDKLQLSGTYLYNPVKRNGVLPLYTTLASAASTAASPDTIAQANLGGRVASQNFTVSGIYSPNQTLSLDIRFGRGYLNEGIRSDDRNYSYGIPNATNYTCAQTACSAGNAGYRLFQSNSLINKDISIRKTFDAIAGVYLPKLAGTHIFRVGYQYNGLSNDVDFGNVSTGTLDFNVSPTSAATDRNGVTRGPTNPTDAANGVIGIGTLTLSGTFGKAASNNEAIFVQDSWQVNNRLTLNLGVRLEREDIPSFRDGASGIKFNWTDKLAPRLGFAMDVLGNGKWKIFGSYGRFFDRFKYELSRGSFGGDTQLVYTFLVVSPNIFSYTRAGVIANNINLADQRIPSNDPSDNRIDPDIKPFQQTEYTFGTAFDFGKGFIFEGRYTHKQVDRTIDDIGFHSTTGATQDEFYFIGNPGFGICAKAACGQYDIPNHPGIPKAERIYDAMELRVRRRLGNFGFDASYTLSRLFGNYSGSASSDEAQRAQNDSPYPGQGRNAPNVSRYYDLPFIGFTADGKPDNGRLPTDRPHYFKLAGNYTFNWFGSRSNTTDLNAFYFIASGTPVTTRARIGGVTGQIVNSRGDLGRTDTLSQTDFGLTHRYRFGKDRRFTLVFDVNVLNLLNQATELGRRETITRLDIPYSVFGCTTDVCIDRGFFNGQITSAKVLAYAQTTGAMDTRFNLPQIFQSPRATRFGFRFIF